MDILQERYRVRLQSLQSFMGNIEHLQGGTIKIFKRRFTEQALSLDVKWRSSLLDTYSTLKKLQLPLLSNPIPLYTVYIAVLLTKLKGGCQKTSPQRYYVIRLVGEISWQESNQLDNFNCRSKFLKISSTTYIENKQCTEFQPQ